MIPHVLLVVGLSWSNGRSSGMHGEGDGGGRSGLCSQTGFERLDYRMRRHPTGMRCSNPALRWLPELAPPQFPVDVSCYFTAAVFTTVELSRVTRARPGSAAADREHGTACPVSPRSPSLLLPAPPGSRDTGQGALRDAAERFRPCIPTEKHNQCLQEGPCAGSCGISLSPASSIPPSSLSFARRAGASFSSGKPWTRSKVDVAITTTRGGGE